MIMSPLQLFNLLNILDKDDNEKEEKKIERGEYKMSERNLIIVTILVTFGLILIVLGLVVGIFQASKESYCNSLELQEYLENRDRCKEYVER